MRNSWTHSSMMDRPSASKIPNYETGRTQKLALHCCSLLCNPPARRQLIKQAIILRLRRCRRPLWQSRACWLLAWWLGNILISLLACWHFGSCCLGFVLHGDWCLGDRLEIECFSMAFRGGPAAEDPVPECGICHSFGRHWSNQTVWSSSSTCKMQYQTCRNEGIRKKQDAN